MVDLIPVGTVNRTATENNSVKSSANVKAAAQPDEVAADHKQQVEAPRRRFKRRKGDRRKARGVRWNKPERRKNPDRRASAIADDRIDEHAVKDKHKKAPRGSSRKGRFIDVRA